MFCPRLVRSISQAAAGAWKRCRRKRRQNGRNGVLLPACREHEGSGGPYIGCWMAQSGQQGVIGKCDVVILKGRVRHTRALDETRLGRADGHADYKTEENMKHFSSRCFVTPTFVTLVAPITDCV